MLRATEGWKPIPRSELSALLVAEPNAPGMAELETADDEIRTVAGLLMSVAPPAINDVGAGTLSVQEVADRLPDAHILHLACHGQQMANPLESHFALRDGPLAIADLMKLKLPHATLAFLSACETAKADQKQPDQAVHLAASLLFCGFRSVIATMW
jgi:CHAT domain-containing protein